MSNEHIDQTPDHHITFSASAPHSLYTKGSPDKFSIRSENSSKIDIKGTDCDIPRDLEYTGISNTQT